MKRSPSYLLNLFLLKVKKDLHTYVFTKIQLPQECRNIAVNIDESAKFTTPSYTVPFSTCHITSRMLEIMLYSYYRLLSRQSLKSSGAVLIAFLWVLVQKDLNHNLVGRGQHSKGECQQPPMYSYKVTVMAICRHLTIAIGSAEDLFVGWNGRPKVFTANCRRNRCQ